MIQEAPTAPVVTPGVPAELSPAPVTDGKTTERETAPHQERYRPSGRLMWHIAHGEFNGGVYPTKTTSVVSEKSYQALQAQHEDVRKTDSFLRENRVKEWLRGKIPGIQDSDMTSQLLHHAEMEMWAKGEAQAVARMLAAGDSHTAEALQKLGFIIPDNTPDAHSDQALKDALYRSTSDQSGEYGSFYGAFCRSGMDTNKLLAQKLTEEEMDVIKPFLTDILGGETAFQALKALKQTQHAVAILPSEDQTKIYTDEPDFKNDNEQKVFNYFQKGSELAKKQPTPLPAPETVSQPEQNPTPPETTAIPQWPPLDYAKLADEVSLDKFSQNGSIRDLQDAVSNIQPVQLSHDISLEIIYDNLTNRNPPISSPDLEFDANDQAMREYQRYVDTKNQDRDPSQQIPINSTRHDPKSGTTEFFVDRTTIFPFHYVKPINQWADKSPLTRAYITIDPAHARYLYRDFVDLAYTLSDAGIEFEAKAIEPEKLGQRQESMTLYFPEGQQEKAGQIIQTYLTEHPGFAHGHLITALPDTVDGLSWAREPDTVQTNLVREITGTTEHSVSYNEFVSAMTLPFYLQRIEKMYRDAGKTADANIIHQEFERVHAVMQKYTPKQEAEQKLTNAETSREQPKTVEDIRREVFENAGRRSAEEVSQLIGDVQQILTQEKEAGRGKMKATIQEMNDSPDTNQTKPTREGEVVFLPKGAGRLVALGDIHGDLATIQQVLTKEHVLEDLAAGSPVQVVFMGDLVDRGPKDIEVMEAVMMLKKLYPDHITIMKADHEMTRDEINHHPITDHGFPTHLGNRFHQDGVRLNNELADLFDLSPRMVEGANGLRLVHGGPGMQPLNLQEYAHLSQEEIQRIFDREITWADPVSNGDKATNLKSQKGKMLGDLRKRIDTNDFSPYFEPPSNPKHGTSGAPVLTTPEEIKELYQLLSELPEGFYPNIERTSSKSILRALRHGRLAYTEEGLQAPLKTVGDRVILRAHQTSRQVSGGEDAIKFGGKLGSIHTTGKGSPESAYSGGEPHPRYAVFDLAKPITQITPDNIKDVWTAEAVVATPSSTDTLPIQHVTQDRNRTSIPIKPPEQEHGPQTQYTDSLLTEKTTRDRPAPPMLILAQQLDKATDYFRQQGMTSNEELALEVAVNFGKAGLYQRIVEQHGYFGPQAFERSKDTQSTIKAATQNKDRMLQLTQQALGNGERVIPSGGWLHYFSPHTPEQRLETQYRIYLNPDTAKLPNVLASLLHYAEGNDLYFKAADPRDPELFTRLDTIVVYLNKQNADRVTHFIQDELLVKHRDAFHGRVAPGSSGVTIGPGIGLAAQPARDVNGAEITAGQKNASKVEEALRTFSLDEIKRTMGRFSTESAFVNSPEYRLMKKAIESNWPWSMPEAVRHSPQTTSLFTDSLLHIAYMHAQQLTITANSSSLPIVGLPMEELLTIFKQKLQDRGLTQLATTIDSLTPRQLDHDYGSICSLNQGQLTRAALSVNFYGRLHHGQPLGGFFLDQYDRYTSATGRKPELTQTNLAIRSIEKYPGDNEDHAFFGESSGGMFDGMGGHADGEKASKLAMYVVGQELLTIPDNASLQQVQKKVAEAMKKANDQVVQAYPHGGTTGSVFKIWKGSSGERKVVVANVGDSRMWIKKRNGDVMLLTHDDSLLKQRYMTGKISLNDYFNIQNTMESLTSLAEVERPITLENGDQFDLRPYWSQRNVITRSLGDTNFTMDPVQTFDIETGDIIFYTSDGVHDNLSTNEILQIVTEAKTAQELTEKLTQAASGVSQLSIIEDYRAKPDDITAGAMVIS